MSNEQWLDVSIRFMMYTQNALVRSAIEANHCSSWEGLVEILACQYLHALDMLKGAEEKIEKAA